MELLTWYHCYLLSHNTNYFCHLGLNCEKNAVVCEGYPERQVRKQAGNDFIRPRFMDSVQQRGKLERIRVEKERNEKSLREDIESRMTTGELEHYKSEREREREE